MTNQSTPESFNHTPESPEAQAEHRLQQRNNTVEILNSEGFDASSAEAYDTYKGLIDSVIESAKAGELTTSAQEAPFTEEQALKQLIDAFDVQNGKLDMPVKGARLIPRSAGMRLTFVSLLGSMSSGSEPSPHSAAVEGMVREAYHNITHPEAAALIGTEARPEAEVEVPVEEDATPDLESEFPSREQLESTADSEPGVELDATEERQIKSVHEARVGMMADSLNEELSRINTSMQDYEGAGRSNTAVYRLARQEVEDMLLKVRNFDNYGVEGARKVLSNMDDSLALITGSLYRSGAELADPEGRIRGALVGIEDGRQDSEKIDNDAKSEFIQRELYESAGEVASHGAESVQSVAEDAANVAGAVQSVARELAEAAAQDGRSINQIATYLKEELTQSYSSGQVDADQVGRVLRQALEVTSSDIQSRNATKLAELASEASAVLSAARQQISQR